MIVRMLVVLAVFLVGTLSSVMAEDVGVWPRDVHVDSGIITVYEPQIDSLKTSLATSGTEAKAASELKKQPS